MTDSTVGGSTPVPASPFIAPAEPHTPYEILLGELDKVIAELITGAHGVARRQVAVPLIAVAEEWSYLKRACWQTLARHGVVEESARVAMGRLDVLFGDAIGYTLRGYHQPELDSLKGAGLERRDGASDRRRGPDNRRDGTAHG